MDIVEQLAELVKALEAGNYNAAPGELKQGCGFDIPTTLLPSETILKAIDEEEKTPTTIPGWSPLNGFDTPTNEPDAPRKIMPILCHVCGYEGYKDDRIVSGNVCRQCAHLVIDG